LRQKGSQAIRLSSGGSEGLSVVFRRAFAFALLFLALAGGIPASAIAATSKHAAFVIDANSGAVLHNEDGDAVRHPASLTKMMTLYLTFELLDSGRLKMSDMITISKRAASVAPSKLDLKPGEQISVSDAIRAIVTKSANDIAVALAEKIGGTEANFVRLMNTRARDIGMTKTHFENPSGLPDDDHVSSARDMATLALRLMDDFPNHYKVFATRTFAYRGKSYRNHNTMLNTFSGVDGIKTGYTRASGFNLVTSAHRGGRHLVGVVFGGRTAASRNTEMRVLLTKAFTRASTSKTRKSKLIAKLNSEPKAAPRRTTRRDPIAEIAAAEPVRGRAEKNAQAAPAADTGSRETPIQVYKVRHVPVLAKPGAGSPDESTDMEGADSPDVGGSAPDREPEARPNLGRFAFANKAMPRATPEMLGASDRLPAPEKTGSLVEPVTFAPPSEPAAAPQPARIETASASRAFDTAQPTPQRGLPPSTLNAQASALGGRSIPPAQHGQRQITQVSASAGSYEVQIGAFGSIADAQRALNSVQDRARQLLAGVPSVTHPGNVNGRQIFRARFAGFDADRAASTCTELRRKGVDCFVMAGQ
jgi:D-alanyl-D-alanine carboxypeptidase